MGKLWELADSWEDRFRDKQMYGPLARHIWRQAWEELTERLDSRREKQ